MAYSGDFYFDLAPPAIVEALDAALVAADYEITTHSDNLVVWTNKRRSGLAIFVPATRRSVTAHFEQTSHGTRVGIQTDDKLVGRGLESDLRPLSKAVV